MAPEALAGWIFADLLIVLFIVGLGASVPGPEPIVTPPPTSPTSTAATPEPPPPPPPPSNPALKPKSVNLPTKFDPDDLLGSKKRKSSELRSVCTQLKKELAHRKLQNERAALVIIFAGEVNTRVEVAQRRAAAIGKGLRGCTRQKVFGKKLVFRNYWDGNLKRGSARVEIFMYTRA